MRAALRANMLNMLELNNVVKSFFTPSPIEVLRDVSMKVDKGQWVSLMGPSGSGKSTLLSLIAALDTPTSGKVIINQQDIAELSEEERANFRAKQLGFIFQSFRLIPHLNIIENVLLPSRILDQDPSSSRERAKSLLEEVGLKDRMTHTPGQLSGGEQQRVAIARAFLTKPTLLLADEPTGNLDEDNSETVLNMLEKLKTTENCTMVVVSHDPEVAKRADREFVLSRGVLNEVSTSK